MGRIVVTEFISLDGVIEDPGGAEDFKHGGWSFEISRGDEGDKFKLDETMASEALLLGRVTYEGFAAAWPSRDGEFADKFNTMPKYVVSSTLGDPEWNNTTVLSGDVAEAVAKLKAEQDGDIVVHGSAQLVQALLEQRSRRRVAADGVPGRARERKAPLRRDERQEAAAAGRLEDRSATASRSSSTPRGSTVLEVETPHGPANAHLHAVDAAAERRSSSATAPVAVWRRRTSWPRRTPRTRRESASRSSSSRTASPGGAAPAPARQLDAAWLAVVDELVAGALHGLPLIVGGRSLGARVACRNVEATGAVAVLCLAFPLQPPRDGESHEPAARARRGDGPDARRAGRTRPVRDAARRRAAHGRRRFPATTA